MFKRWIALALVLAVYMPARSFAAEAEANKSAQEYFALNPEGRLLISVQVWGDMTLSGTHHIPDNTTLTALLGVTGGLKGALDNAKVTVRREVSVGSGMQTEIIIVTGDELMGESKQGAMTMKAGDIIYVETAPSGELTLRKLTVISTIIGIISSSLLTYFLITGRK